MTAGFQTSGTCLFNLRDGLAASSVEAAEVVRVLRREISGLRTV
jgi:hypothetical protein